MRLIEQPKGVFLLSFVELWNRFSHYGTRALLVLYMVNELKFPDAKAFGIFAAFTALDRLGGILGAAIADKVLGLRRSILLGGWIVAGGHLLLGMGFFFPGLAALVVGSCLFTTNIMAFVGHFYEKDETKRQQGYTFFYMSINIGAMLATLLCGYVANRFGWEYGFSIAALGMVLGNLAMMAFRPVLEGKGGRPAGVSRLHRLGLYPALLLLGSGVVFLLQIDILSVVPFIILGCILAIGKKLRAEKELWFTLIGYVLFIASAAQIQTSMLLCADRLENRTLFGFPISSTVLLAVNPIVVITLGSLAANLTGRIQQVLMKLFIPLILMGLSFLILGIGHLWLTMGNLMLLVGAMAFAEVCLGPQAYSRASVATMKYRDSKVMSLIPLCYALGFTLGGGLSKAATLIGVSWGYYAMAVALLGSSFAIMGFQLLQKQKRGATH